MDVLAEEKSKLKDLDKAHIRINFIILTLLDHSQTINIFYTMNLYAMISTKISEGRKYVN